ncbi:MAG: hypothetical protein HYY96_03325 [Candidatus Tectomicrobia bacterium]|nr:hypothetical protein [Candidatus Tectomicrobia bacterium]
MEQEHSITYAEFHILRCQATLFTPDEEVSGAKIARGLLSSWSKRFDADPFIIPQLDRMPREVPRIVLKNHTEDWNCEISSERITIAWRRPKVEVAVPSLNQFYSEAITMLVEYVDFLKTRVGRIGAVVIRYAAHPAPGKFLSKHFCKEDWLVKPLNRPEGFELHAHKRFELSNEFLVNSWVRNKSGFVFTADNGGKPAVLVEQDLNTLSEEVDKCDYTSTNLESFFLAAAREFDIILGLYYPTGD